MRKCLCSLGKAEDGATAVEYGLMLALIAVAIVASVTALGIGVDGLFGGMTAAVTAVGS